MKTYHFKSVKNSDYVETNWRNGLGKTLELWKSPADSTNESFDWRISIAAIDASNDFSLYNNYNRSITQLNGGQMELYDENLQFRHRLKIFEPYFFSGADKIFCELTLPQAHDFNVMTRSKVLTQNVECLSFSQDNLIKSISVEKFCFIYAVKGSCKISDNEVIVEKNSALITADGVEIIINATEPGTVLMIACVTETMQT